MWSWKVEAPTCEPKKTLAVTLLAVSGAPLISMRGQDTLCGNSVWNLILTHDKYTFAVCCYNLYKDKKDKRILSFTYLSRTRAMNLRGHIFLIAVKVSWWTTTKYWGVKREVNVFFFFFLSWNQRLNYGRVESKSLIKVFQKLKFSYLLIAQVRKRAQRFTQFVSFTI